MLRKLNWISVIESRSTDEIEDSLSPSDSWIRLFAKLWSYCLGVKIILSNSAYLGNANFEQFCLIHFTCKYSESHFFYTILLCFSPPSLCFALCNPYRWAPILQSANFIKHFWFIHSSHKSIANSVGENLGNEKREMSV